VKHLVTLYLAQEREKDVTVARFAEWCLSEGVKQGIDQGVRLEKQRRESRSFLRQLQESEAFPDYVKDSVLGTMDAAAYLQCSRSAVIKWANSGLLRYELREWNRNGKQNQDGGDGNGAGRTARYFSVRDLDDFQEQRSNGGRRTKL